MTDELLVADPPLKWPGGKRWLISALIDLYDRRRRLVDPFVGGLSIPLGLRPEKALLGDANPHLMNFYRWLKHGLVIDEIELIYAEDRYYQARDLFNQLAKIPTTDGLWSKKAASLFYYLNRSGYNGLCRFNTSGDYNVPFGEYKNVDYHCDFRGYSGMMMSWVLWVGDFEQIPTQPDDFIYADPPYDESFNQFTPDRFSWNDQERLAVWLASHKGPVVTSNLATARIVDLYKTLGFDIRYVEAPRRISCTGDREPVAEMLAVKQEG